MASPDRRSHGDVEGLLKRFRRELNESGQLRDYRRKRYFVSKGEMMREKRRKAERRRRRREFRIKQREAHHQRK